LNKEKNTGILQSMQTLNSETDLFISLMSKESLIATFDSTFTKSQSKGIDRLNGFQFLNRASEQLEIASRKCLDGSYRFSPYLEHLKLKGRGKEPRVVGIPCVRDRVVLNQLNKYLSQVFPECVPKNIANSYIREISADLIKQSLETTYICGSDIQKFYDTIKRDRLEKILSKRIKNHEALALIRHALNTPTVPKNTPRSYYSNYKQKSGVPQGLAISNILSAIYLHDVDTAMRKFPVKYYRYVDDVLMYGNEDELHKAQLSLSNRLKTRGLKLHTHNSKSHFGPLNKPFEYLGYKFNWPQITVRNASVERLLQSLAAKLSDYTHNKSKRLERFKYLDEEKLAEIFILELNERITGAISENKRYGWIAYFSQITDLRLLYHLDAMVESLFSRLPDFNRQPPRSLKKFSRAYFEMKFNPTGNYIRNYDIITNIPEKIEFLIKRGRIGPTERLTNFQIEERYERYRKRVLSEMLADEGMIYS
jgi:RNA-directed DNA polymerase